MIQFLLAVALAGVADDPITHGPLVGGVTSTSFKVSVRGDTNNQNLLVEYGVAGVATWPAAAVCTHCSTSAACLSLTTNDLMCAWEITGLSADTAYEFRIRNGASSKFTRVIPRRTFPTDSTIVPLFRVDSFGDAYAKLTGTASWGAALNLTPDPVVACIDGDIAHTDPMSGEFGADGTGNWVAMHKGAVGDVSYGFQFNTKIVNSGIAQTRTWGDHDRGDNDCDITMPYARQGFARDAFGVWYGAADYPLEDSAGVGVWHHFRYAQLEEFVTDTYTYADPDYLPDDCTLVRDAVVPDLFACDCGSGIVKTRLGAEQLEWLINGVCNSTATWKLVDTSVAWNPSVPKRDAWASYPGEQAYIEDQLDLCGATGVIMSSGDVHEGHVTDGVTGGGVFPECMHATINIAGGLPTTPTHEAGDWLAGGNAVGFCDFLFEHDGTGDHVTLTTYDQLGVSWGSVRCTPDACEPP